VHVKNVWETLGFVYLGTFGVLKLKSGVKTLSYPMQQLYSFRPSGGYESVGTTLCMMSICRGFLDH
jgi:hypothetical protein